MRPLKITFNQVAAVGIIITAMTMLVLLKNLQAETRAALTSLMLLAGNFLFGSTSGSQAKDHALANSTPIVPPAPAPETTAAPDPTQANI